MRLGDQKLGKFEEKIFVFKEFFLIFLTLEEGKKTPVIPKKTCLKLEKALEKVDFLPNEISEVIRKPWVPFIFVNPKEKKNLPDVYIPIFSKGEENPLTPGKKFSKMSMKVKKGKLLIIDGEIFRRWAEAFLQCHGSVNLGPVNREDNLLMAPTAVTNARNIIIE